MERFEQVAQINRCKFVHGKKEETHHMYSKEGLRIEENACKQSFQERIYPLPDHSNLCRNQHRTKEIFVEFKNANGIHKTQS